MSSCCILCNYFAGSTRRIDRSQNPNRCLHTTAGSGFFRRKTARKQKNDRGDCAKKTTIHKSILIVRQNWGLIAGYDEYACTVAPPLEKPVDVFTKSSPASMAGEPAVIFSSSVNKHVSRITLVAAIRVRPVSTTSARSFRTKLWFPDFSMTTFITMSVSCAPSLNA